MKLWKKSLLMIMGIIALTAGAATVYVSTVLNSTTQAFSKTYAEAGNADAENIIKATEPLTILLMGVDTGGAGRGGSTSWDGNSDSQIVMTLNPKTNTTTMVSIERDIMSNILDEKGNAVSTQKVNAAYPMGYNAGGLETGVEYALKTIGDQAGIPVDNFLMINFDGLVNLVNDVGGIDIDNTTGQTLYISDTEPEYTEQVPPGKQHIDGRQALVYARDRHHLPNGDYGRAAHQREVISAVMKKLLALNNITQYQKFLNDISKDIKTNIPINSSTLTSLLGYKDCFNKVVSIQYQAIGYTNPADGGSYQLLANNTALAVQNALRSSLQKETGNRLSDNLITYETLTGNAPSSYFMPSATVTEHGKSTVYGIDVDGSFVKLDSSNSTAYVSTDGSAATSDKPASSDETKSSAEQSSSPSVPYSGAADDGTGYYGDGTTVPGSGGAVADDTTTYANPYAGQ
ncbi:MULTISPECIES: LCP family protein [Lactococcus]|uniref:LCP family protein n=1 Tax=Lactococcus TaxID=1357 RepID=UPI000EBF5114|nr:MULTISPECIES: LCP family protein [unclassified Lactococcus]HAP15075.1 LytR family transcriptional regulator [Lactococcus sp.]